MATKKISTAGTIKSNGVLASDPKPEIGETGRKRRCQYNEKDRLRVFVKYKELREINDELSAGKKRVDSELWRDALRYCFPNGPWPSDASLSNYRKEWKEWLDAGKLNVEPAPHDHRPAAARGFVQKVPTPTPEQEEVAAAPTPAPVTFDKPKATDTKTPTPQAAASTMDPAQMIAMGITMLVDKVVGDRLNTLVGDLTKAMDAKLNDQYLRLLGYWDPEAAKQVRDGAVTLPSLESFMTKPNTESAEVLPIKVTPPPPPKKKVLIVGGKDDGFWSYIQDCLPDCTIQFADGHKPRSIPTGTKFDFVLVHFMTSHPARAVIKNYYPNHVFMPKGGKTEAIDIISNALGLVKVASDRRKVA